MISFLNGLILPALIAAGIPLILHLLSRKKARKIPFSSIKFLKVLENQRIKRVKLYQFLLILVRTLFIIFLVLTFARPTINSLTGDLAGKTQTTAVFILDDSYSMQTFASSQTYMELASQFLENLLPLFKPDDKLFLLSGSADEPILLNTKKKESLVKQLKAGNNTIKLENLLSRADSLFRNKPNLNNELYLLSDFKIQDNHVYPRFHFEGINNFKAYKTVLGKNVAFNNVSIDSVRINNQLIEIGKAVNISVFITNHNRDEATETNLNLFKEDTRVAMDFLSLDAGETKKVGIQYIPQTAGTHYLKLQTDEDDLSLDNDYYFSLYLKEKIKALFVSAKPSPEMDIATKILAQNSLLQIDKKNQDEWLGTNLNVYDLLILQDPKESSPQQIHKLQTFLESGHSVIIIPGKLMELEGYNSIFKALGSNTHFTQLNESGKNGFFSLENEKSSNAVFDALFQDKSSSFSAPKLFKYYTQKGFDESLVALSNKNVFLSRSKSLYVFSASFSTEWSDFSGNGLFLPLLYRTFYMSAQGKTLASEKIFCGNEIIFQSEKGSVDSRYLIQNPNKESFSVIPEPVKNKFYFKGGKADAPGFYLLLENKKIVNSIAVNHAANELKQPYVNDASFAFGIETLIADDFKNQIIKARSGFELWQVFLILALLMLLTEMVLIKKIEGLPLFR